MQTFSFRDYLRSLARRLTDRNLKRVWPRLREAQSFSILPRGFIVSQCDELTTTQIKEWYPSAEDMPELLRNLNDQARYIHAEIWVRSKSSSTGFAKVNGLFTLDGQTIILGSVEIYPTFL
jgi:hypothetical protein